MLRNFIECLSDQDSNFACDIPMLQQLQQDVSDGRVLALMVYFYTAELAFIQLSSIFDQLFIILMYKY